MASKRLQNLLRDIELLTQENELDFLAATFSMAFSSNSAAVNPDIFNTLYYIRFVMGVHNKMPVILYERCLTTVLK